MSPTAHETVPKLPAALGFRETYPVYRRDANEAAGGVGWLSRSGTLHEPSCVRRSMLLTPDGAMPLPLTECLCLDRHPCCEADRQNGTTGNEATQHARAAVERVFSFAAVRLTTHPATSYPRANTRINGRLPSSRLALYPTRTVAS
jgi:hypothetical protein